MSAEHWRMMLAYNRWAHEKVLAATSATDEAGYFEVVPGLSFGSLHGTLVHALAAEVVWIARFRGELPPDALKDARRSDLIATGEIPSLQRLREVWSEEWRKQEEYAAALRDEDIERPVSYRTQYGEANTQPLVQLLAHFLNHGTQFRSEAAVRLTQLGASPGDLDLIIYVRERGAS